MVQSTAFEARPCAYTMHFVLRALCRLSYFIIITIPIKELLLCIGHQALYEY